MSTLTNINSTDSPASTPQKPLTPDSVAVTSTKTILSVEEIQKLLPHRYPFAFVDRIVEYVPGKRAVGIKNVTFNEPHFQGHFPGRPLMPGVLIVEAMAQVGGVVLTQLPEKVEGGLLVFAGMDKVRFRRPVVPGDQLVMTVELLWTKHRRFGKMKGRAEVDGQLVAEGELLFSLVEYTQPPQSESVTVTSAKTIFTVEEIQKLLPHRYPFALVDRVVEYLPGERAMGIKNVTFNEPYFQGHFPGQPLMPGVLIVEAMAQVGGVVLTQLPEKVEGGLLVFAGMDKVRFRRLVVPGDQLVITVELLCTKRRRFGKMQGRAEVDGQLVAEGELLFSLVD